MSLLIRFNIRHDPLIDGNQLSKDPQAYDSCRLDVKHLFVDWGVIMQSWKTQIKLRYIRWLAVILFAAASLS